MRRLTLLSFAFALLLPLSVFSAKTKKAVYIILDGIPADVIERLDPPAIKAVAAEGGYSRAYCGGTVGRYDQTPTISAVGYNCILTATWANKHEVWDNSPKPDYNYWSIFRIAKEQKKNFKTGLYSSWTDNRTVLLGEGLPETGNLKIDYVADGLDLDTKNYPKEKDDLHIFKIDEAISEAAAEGIRNDAPDMSWVYLWYTDDAGHYYGNGDFMDEYVMKADKQVERIREAVKYREANYDEEWLLIVTTDHGRGPDGYHHGGQSERERTSWIATNVQPNAHFAAPLLSIVDIAPTICRYLGFEVPTDVLWEQDGMPFIGKADIAGIRIDRSRKRKHPSGDSGRPLFYSGKQVGKAASTDTPESILGTDCRFPVRPERPRSSLKTNRAARKDGPASSMHTTYSAFKISRILIAAVEIGVPGPKIAAAPALYRSS